jgi:sodium-dependent dicarboxylate transporter 2/3/5
LKRIASLLTSLTFAGLTLLLLDDPVQARTAAVCVLCIGIWLGELLPPFVPTLLLVGTAPLLVPGMSAGQALSLGVDPVLTLFFGGFILGAAVERTGLASRLASYLTRIAKGRAWRLLILIALGTAFLSMWMSNVAATALMLAALGPVVHALPETQKRAPLLAVAIAANVGGLATPIGTAPNAIALSVLAKQGVTVRFVEWLGFGVPLAVTMLVVGFVAIRLTCNVLPGTRYDIQIAYRGPMSLSERTALAVAAIAALMWLLEPVHHVPAGSVALLAATAFFVFGVLDGNDLKRLDWSTLLLIAGGIAIGRLLQEAGAIQAATSALDWEALPAGFRTAAFVLTAALLSALMSNTATATLLIPFAMAVDPTPSTAILIAVGCSLGMPFVISTPPNAMAVAAGAQTRDLLRVGGSILVVGVTLAALLGPQVLGWILD